MDPFENVDLLGPAFPAGPPRRARSYASRQEILTDLHKLASQISETLEKLPPMPHAVSPRQAQGLLSDLQSAAAATRDAISLTLRES